MITITEYDKQTKEKGGNPIFLVTTLEKDGSELDKYKFPDYGASRTVGFFPEIEDARAAVKSNCGDIHEYLYNFVVIEKMYPGFYPCCIDDNDFEWYRFNHEFRCYEMLENHVRNSISCNFAIG